MDVIGPVHRLQVLDCIAPFLERLTDGLTLEQLGIKTRSKLLRGLITYRPKSSLIRFPSASAPDRSPVGLTINRRFNIVCCRRASSHLATERLSARYWRLSPAAEAGKCPFTHKVSQGTREAPAS